MEKKSAKELELEPKTAKTLSSVSQGAGIFQKKGSRQECQTLEKSSGFGHRRLIPVELGDQRLDSKTANRDGSLKKPSNLPPASTSETRKA